MEQPEPLSPEQLQMRVMELESTIERLNKATPVVQDLVQKMLGQYRPATTFVESTEQFTTAELLRKMKAMDSSIAEQDLVNAMQAAGFTTDQVDAEFFWLLRHA